MSKYDNYAIGEKLRYRRQQLGLKASDVAIYLGVSRETVYRHERGLYPINLTQAKELAFLYDISLNDIVGNDITT